MARSTHEFFASTKGSHRTQEGTVLVLPGLLGERTMRQSVAIPLANEGFNVLYVDHNRSRMINHNQCRSVDIHDAAKQAIEETGGDKTIHLLAHSLGGNDIIGFAEYVSENPDLGYRIHGIGGMAMVGLNGYHPDIIDVIKELNKQKGLIVRNLGSERDVFWSSAKSLLRNPLLALAEGITASVADNRNRLGDLENRGVIKDLREIYGKQDLMVPPPTDRLVDTYDEHHMTPVHAPDIAIHMARLITNSHSQAA